MSKFENVVVTVFLVITIPGAIIIPLGIKNKENNRATVVSASETGATIALPRPRADGFISIGDKHVPFQREKPSLLPLWETRPTRPDDDGPVAQPVRTMAVETAKAEAARMAGEKLREQFRREVGPSTSTADQRLYVVGDIEARLGRTRVSDQLSSRPQVIVWVDRNPATQRVEVLTRHERQTQTDYLEIGWAKCSTGDPTQKDHFETPLGVFENSPRHPSFRAAGTPNSIGFRGYGKKGSRIWDFGWQETSGRFASGKKGSCNIRLMLHATDPDSGEPLLGTRQSKGCVRISEKLNRFIDRYQLLDLIYVIEERVGPLDRTLEGTEELFAYPGALLVIGDSRLLPGSH